MDVKATNEHFFFWLGFFFFYNPTQRILYKKTNRKHDYKKSTHSFDKPLGIWGGFLNLPI